MSPDTQETVSDRLRQALQLPNRERVTMRGLHRRLQEEGRFDKAFSTMYAYLTGETEPPTSFIGHAAEVLQVRSQWLFTGEGPRTGDEAEVMYGGSEHEARATLARELQGRLDGLAHLDYIVTATLIHSLQAHEAAHWMEPIEISQPDNDPAGDLWDQIHAPFRKGTTPMYDGTFKNYALAAIHARTLALEVTTTTKEEDSDVS